MLDMPDETRAAIRRDEANRAYTIRAMQEQLPERDPNEPAPHAIHNHTIREPVVCDSSGHMRAAQPSEIEAGKVGK